MCCLWSTKSRFYFVIFSTRFYAKRKTVQLLCALLLDSRIESESLELRLVILGDMKLEVLRQVG